MTIEVTEAEDMEVVPPPIDPAPIEEQKVIAAPSKLKRPDKPPTGKPPGEDRAPSVLQQIRWAEDQSIKDVLSTFGTDGAFRIRIIRKEPQEVRDPATGKVVKTHGFLRQYEEAIEVEDIQKSHGGGKYEVRIQRRASDGSYKYFTARTFDIAGDPNLDDPSLARIVTPANAPATPATPNGESPSLVKEAFGVLRDQLDREREDKGKSEDMSPATKALFDMMGDQLVEMRRELAESRKAAQEAQKPPAPVTDPFKDNMLNKLMMDDSARLAAQRNQYESEIRVIKENAAADERRLRDSFERDKQFMMQTHERELTASRASLERELAAAKQSHEIQLAAVKQSAELTKTVLESDNKKLRDEIRDLREDMKELRAKKDKTLPEQVREMNALKELLGSDDDGEDKSTVGKIFETITNPETIGAVGAMFGKGPQVQQPQNFNPQAQRPQIVRAADGKIYHQHGNQLLPVKRKPKPPPPPIVNPDGTVQAPLPEIPPEQVAQVVGLLERAFSGNQDAEVFAQSVRVHVPDAVMAILRDHGVDVFTSKVAKLQSASPLASQAGRNWTRKVAKALVGE